MNSNKISTSIAYKIGVIMDPIHTINIKKDSTFAIMLEAEKLKFEVYYIEQENIFYKDGIVYAYTKRIKLFNNSTCWYTFLDKKPLIISLKNLNITFMRVDPPVNENYIYTLMLLDIAKRKNQAFIVNNPSSLLTFNEKNFITLFEDCIPPTIITSNKNLITEFTNKYDEIILKSLNSLGGNSIFKINKADPNLNVIIETITNKQTCKIMAQKFIPEITKTGDKRILMLNGKPFPYTLARYPSSNDFRGNLAKGGQGIVEKLSKTELQICQKVGTLLKKYKIYFAGIDVIGKYLTEINITSPTCIREIEAHTQLNICNKLLTILTK